MAAAVIDSAMTSLPATSQQARPALRRATYVHVSDLTSAYNIDHARLEQELTRVKAEREASESSKPAGIGNSEVDPSGPAADFDTALVSAPQKRLQPPRGGYNLCVLVGKVNVVVDKRRVDRSRVRLAEVEIGDETGTVSLRARDEQIDALEEVSNRSGAVVLRNCTLELYQGKHIRLAVTKWGKLSVYPDNVASTPPPPSKMNFDKNFSLIDLSVVASETVEQQQESGYGNRAGKSSESQDTRSASTKSSGQTHSKHQQQQSSTRRNNRDKRQSRGKGGNSPGVSSHYAAKQADAGSMQPQASQMRYHGLQPYPGYDQAMDMSQYPYTHNRQPDVMASSSAQHLLLQQYELQQRQLQMYHSQQDRHRTGMGQAHQVQAPGMMLQHVVPSGSFDTPGEYQVPTYGTGADQRQHPSMMAVVGSNPMLVPVGAVPGISSRGGTTAAGKSHQDRHGIAGVPMSSQLSLGKTDSGRPDHPQQSGVPRQTDRESQFMSVSPDDASQISAGKMNPEATAFAPAYMGHQGSHPPGQQVYFPFPHSASTSAYRTPAHHPGLYPQGIMYVPAAGASPANVPGDTSSVPTGAEGGTPNDPKATEKENMK